MSEALSLMADSLPKVEDKSFLLFSFPEQRRLIGHLSLEEKMEWYTYQFQRYAGGYPVELTSEEFKRFWKWRVVMPIRIKRLFYRIKNRQIFKHYEHITEMKKKAKTHSI